MGDKWLRGMLAKCDDLGVSDGDCSAGTDPAAQPCPDCARLRALLREAYVVLKRSELVASFVLCPKLKKDIEALIARIAAEVLE